MVNCYSEYKEITVTEVGCMPHLSPFKVCVEQRLVQQRHLVGGGHIKVDLCHHQLTVE